MILLFELKIINRANKSFKSIYIKYFLLLFFRNVIVSNSLKVYEIIETFYQQIIIPKNRYKFKKLYEKIKTHF